MLFVVIQGCGYHVASRKFSGGAGKTIAIPTFVNQTTNFRLEQRLTDAVRREFIERTQFRVTSQGEGDLVLTGIVHGFGGSPIFFDDRGRASAYNIVVDLGISVKDSSTGQVILRNDHWGFSEAFELARVSADFVPEDSAAIDRLARKFASSLVAALLQQTP